MSALPMHIGKEAGRPLTPLQIFDITAPRETTLSRLPMAYAIRAAVHVASRNLSRSMEPFGDQWRRAADSVSPAWIQAHGLRKSNAIPRNRELKMRNNNDLLTEASWRR